MPNNRKISKRIYRLFGPRWPLNCCAGIHNILTDRTTFALLPGLILMAINSQLLEPTKYHRTVVDLLRSEEAELWDWFSSRKAQTEFTETFRVSLLKSSYRLNAQSHPELAEAAEQAKARLGLNVPVTLYQSQENPNLNASLYFIPNEAHIVFSGAALSLLNAAEAQSVIGHELAHYLLWEQDGGPYLTADRILQTIALHRDASTSHLQTARRYQLYTEIFADRGSLLATAELPTVISGLVKLQTGLNKVSGESYLAQADEIFASQEIKTQELSHPEAFIRARSLRLWHEKYSDLENELSRIVEHDQALDDLDLTGQHRWSELTRRFLAQLLQPAWFQTADTLAHARMFFPDFNPVNSSAPADASLIGELKHAEPKFAEYIRYLLLDFCAIDPDLDRVPVVSAINWSRTLGFEGEFDKLLTKELKITARELRKLKAEADEMLRKNGGSNE